MIIDKDTLFWDNETTPGAASEFIDLGSERPGPGEPILCFIAGVDAAVTPLELVVQQSPDGVGNIGTVLVVSALYFDKNKVVEFHIPSNSERYARVQFDTAPTSGTFTCGIVLPGNQTAV